MYKRQFYDPDVVGVTRLREVTDDNGSYRITESEYFDMETGEPTSHPTYTIMQVVTMDDHGNAVSEEMFETIDGTTELVSGNKVEYVYNDYGYPSQMTVNIYDYESGEYVPESKTIYGKYVDVSSGIEGVEANRPDDGSFTVYNLQGIQVLRSDDPGAVASLPAGLYIINGCKQVIR